MGRMCTHSNLSLLHPSGGGVRNRHTVIMFFAPVMPVTASIRRFELNSASLESDAGPHRIVLSERFSRRIMNRRDFLRANSSICAGWALSRAVPALANTPSAGEWRTFEVVTKVELLKPDGISHIWLPAALIRNTPYQKTISTRFTAEGGKAALSKDKQSALGIVSATYAANARPALNLASRVALRNYTVDLSSPATARPASRAELDYFLQPSRYVPTDGIVKQTALKATLRATTDIEKARALYEWVVKNTFRDPKVRGCGRGDIRFMLESGDMGGKCADANLLYVMR